jgi:hypothetical protein
MRALAADDRIHGHRLSLYGTHLTTNLSRLTCYSRLRNCFVASFPIYLACLCIGATAHGIFICFGLAVSVWFAPERSCLCYIRGWGWLRILQVTLLTFIWDGFGRE